MIPRELQKFSQKTSFLNTRWAATTLHQDQFRSSSLQKNNPYAYVLARKISTVAVPNRLHEKNPFYGAPGMQKLRRHWSPIFPLHRITLQANRSTSHVMKHCAAAQEIHENYSRCVAGSVISRSNPAIIIFSENRNFGHARVDFHENP